MKSIIAFDLMLVLCCLHAENTEAQNTTKGPPLSTLKKSQTTKAQPITTSQKNPTTQGKNQTTIKTRSDKLQSSRQPPQITKKQYKPSTDDIQATKSSMQKSMAQPQTTKQETHTRITKVFEPILESTPTKEKPQKTPAQPSSPESSMKVNIRTTFTKRKNHNEEDRKTMGKGKAAKAAIIGIACALLVIASVTILLLKGKTITPTLITKSKKSTALPKITKGPQTTERKTKKMIFQDQTLEFEFNEAEWNEAYMAESELNDCQNDTEKENNTLGRYNRIS